MSVAFSKSIGSQQAYSISQMISQNHTANHLNFWLTDWKSRNLPPNEVVIDSSEALWIACVKTFAECHDTNAYITACADSLLLDTKIPKCFIRSDRSHFMKAVTHNKLLKQTHATVQRLLIGIIGYVIQCKSIEECRIILQHLFTLTKNEQITSEVIASKKFLTDLIATHDFPEETPPVGQLPLALPNLDREIDIFQDERKNAATTYRDTSMYRWILNIYESVVTNADAEVDFPNIFHCKKAEDFLLRVFARIPLWSNVMCDKFNSTNFTATSSSSESEFKNIKHLMGIKTSKVSVFVNMHLEQIFGRTISALSNLKSADVVADAMSTKAENASSGQNIRRENRSSSLCAIEHDHDLSTSLNRSRSESDIVEAVPKEKEENWKGRNRTLAEVRRSRVSALEPHDIDYICQDIPLLRNGYTYKRRKAGQKSIIVKNTCSMDSVFTIYAAAFLDNRVTNDEMKNSTSENEFSFLVKSVFTTKGKSDLLYINRTNLLLQIFVDEIYGSQITEDANTKTVDCYTGIGGFFDNLVKRDQYRIASAKTTKRCMNCEYVFERFSACLPFFASIHTNVNLTNLQQYISNDGVTASTCRECGKQALISRTLGNVIAIETEPTTHRTKWKKYKISDLKEKLCVDESVYTLFGLIERVSLSDEKGHFVAYVKRNNGVWQKVDDIENKIVASRSITMTPMFIYMMFFIKELK